MKTHATLRPQALALGALLLAGLPLGSASAAFIHYTVDWTVNGLRDEIRVMDEFRPVLTDDYPGISDPLGLIGSRMIFQMSIDTTGLTPTYNGPGLLTDLMTEWPTTTARVSLAIADSNGGADGTYAGTITGGDSLGLIDNWSWPPSPLDTTSFPSVRFSISGFDVGVRGLVAFFAPSFNNPTGIIEPYPFQATDAATLQSPRITYHNLSESPLGPGFDTSVVRIAASVPLPPTLALFLAGLVAVARSRAATAPARTDRSA